MINLTKYPFRTAIEIGGKTYIEVAELNEILDNLKELGPTFIQIADATEKLRQSFIDTKKGSDNLLVELQKAQQELEGI